MTVLMSQTETTLPPDSDNQVESATDDMDLADDDMDGQFSSKLFASDLMQH